MPDFFSAKHLVEDDDGTDLYTNGVGDSRGFIEDGAYIGRAMPSADSPPTFMDAQEAFTIALRERFLAQRAQIHTNPGSEGLAALNDHHPIDFVEGSQKSYRQWLHNLNYTVPLPAQVRSFSQETVFSLLAVLQEYYLLRGRDISTKTSIWIWSLLTRLEDVGNMNNDQVYLVREFGKYAILVHISFYNPAAAEQLDAGGRNDEVTALPTNPTDIPPNLEDDRIVDEQNQQAKQDQISTESEAALARQNTLATLEMIIAIVGDVFGQRDLLEFRRPWEAESAEAAERW